MKYFEQISRYIDNRICQVLLKNHIDNHTDNQTNIFFQAKLSIGKCSWSDDDTKTVLELF